MLGACKTAPAPDPEPADPSCLEGSIVAHRILTRSLIIWKPTEHCFTFVSWVDAHARKRSLRKFVLMRKRAKHHVRNHTPLLPRQVVQPRFGEQAAQRGLVGWAPENSRGHFRSLGSDRSANSM
jgi:hypothetical protein